MTPEVSVPKTDDPPLAYVFRHGGQLRARYCGADQCYRGTLELANGQVVEGKVSLWDGGLVALLRWAQHEDGKVQPEIHERTRI